MKKLIITSMFVIITNLIYAQKVVIIGMNHVTPDGFSFVAADNLSNGEVVFFTENEYDNLNNRFVDQTESVVKFTATSSITKGTVIFVKETATDVFTVTCTGPSTCGTAVKTTGSGNFALATDGEGLYAYTETAGDENPSNGIATIYSVMYDGSGESIPVVNGGNLPTNENPLSDFPTATIIHGFPAALPNRTEFKITTLDRTNVTKAILQNPSNYLTSQANADLSLTIFTTPTILPLLWLSIEGNLNSNMQAVLNWTVEENNVMKYEVQKSIDNIYWNTLESINSKGAGTNNYTTVDNIAIQSNTFYKIKQIDVDGRLSYSSIIKLNNSKSLLNINVYPNPVNDIINLSVGSNLINTHVKIYNIIGKQINTNLLKSNFSQISLKNYPPGVYLFKFESGETQKIYKY